MTDGGMGPVRARPSDVLAALKSGRIEGADARLHAATDLLESSFYEELFKAMRQTVPEGGVLSGGAGQDIFEGLMDQRIAESAAMEGDGGLGEALYRFFSRGSPG
jgi:peptidoglycan hydrolase FlgJ